MVFVVVLAVASAVASAVVFAVVFAVAPASSGKSSSSSLGVEGGVQNSKEAQLAVEDVSSSTITQLWDGEVRCTAGSESSLRLTTEFGLPQSFVTTSASDRPCTAVSSIVRVPVETSQPNK